MSENQISSFLTVSLVVLLSVFFILLIVLVVLMLKEKNKGNTKNKNEANDTSKVKKDVEYTKNSIFDFMEFDKIEDNMIIRKKGRQYIMVMECQGVNYEQ